MSIGLSFRGRSSGKSIRPNSRASARRFGQGQPQRPGAPGRGQQASTWQRGQSTSGQRQAQASLFFSAPPAGKRRTTAPAGTLDILMGRGGYMKAYSKQRKQILRQYQKQKIQLLTDQRRQKEKVRLDLRRQDKDVYQQYNISPGKRPTKRGLDPANEERLADRASKKVFEQVQQAHRHQVRELRKQRDQNVRQMVKELRDSHDPSNATAA